jgi:hypothetical protein
MVIFTGQGIESAVWQQNPTPLPIVLTDIRVWYDEYQPNTARSPLPQRARKFRRMAEQKRE